MTNTVRLEIYCNFKFTLLSSGGCFQCKKMMYINVQHVYKLGFLESYLEQFFKISALTSVF